MKRFLDLADLERDEVSALLELARRLETSPEPQVLLKSDGAEGGSACTLIPRS